MKTVLFTGKAGQFKEEVSEMIRHLKSEGVKTFGDLLVYMTYHNGLMKGVYNCTDLKLTPYGCFICREAK